MLHEALLLKDSSKCDRTNNVVVCALKNAFKDKIEFLLGEIVTLHSLIKTLGHMSLESTALLSLGMVMQACNSSM